MVVSFSKIRLRKTCEIVLFGIGTVRQICEKTFESLTMEVLSVQTTFKSSVNQADVLMKGMWNSENLIPGFVFFLTL